MLIFYVAKSQMGSTEHMRHCTGLTSSLEYILQYIVCIYRQSFGNEMHSNPETFIE